MKKIDFVFYMCLKYYSQFIIHPLYLFIPFVLWFRNFHSSVDFKVFLSNFTQFCYRKVFNFLKSYLSDVSFIDPLFHALLKKKKSFEIKDHFLNLHLLFIEHLNLQSNLICSPGEVINLQFCNYWKPVTFGLFYRMEEPATEHVLQKDPSQKQNIIVKRQKIFLLQYLVLYFSMNFMGSKCWKNRLGGWEQRDEKNVIGYSGSR